MSWIDKLLRRPLKKRKLAPMLDGYSPIYSQFGTDIYASDVVQQAIKCIVDEMRKLNPSHVRYNGNDPVPITNSSVQKILDNPNPLMTTSEFIEKVIWLLMLNYNAFIYPVYHTIKDQNGVEKKVYDAIYPLKPQSVEFDEDAEGKLYVHFYFANNFDTMVPYEDIIHIRHNYSVNEYMGGDEQGHPDHQGLLRTLQLNDDLLKGVSRAMNASYSVNGVVKYNTMLDDGRTEAALKELERKLRNSESGFLPLDIKAEFTPIEHNAQLVDENTLKFIDEKILRNWGVPLPILTGDYTKVQYASFYQKTLEPLIIAMGQAFTKKLFTEREISFGNKVEFYPEDLIFMTVNQVLHMVNLLGNTGAMYENEKRVAFGLRPLPELEGKRYMSLNWINSDLADTYQAKKVNIFDDEDRSDRESFAEEAIEKDGGLDDSKTETELELEIESEPE